MKNIKMKIRIVVLLLVISILYFAGNSFASYVSSVVGGINNNDTYKIQFAKFVVNSTLSDSINFDINNFNPGKTKNIGFYIINSAYNNDNNFVYSDISIKYVITISSYALPLKYSLKKDNTTINLTCTYNNGVSECKTPEIILDYSNNNYQNYVLTVTYPLVNENNQSFYMTYSNSVDVVSLKIDSWQAN